MQVLGFDIDVMEHTGLSIVDSLDQGLCSLCRAQQSFVEQH